jgi:hypothetical protein
MTKGQNRCADCGGRFGLIVHRHATLKFCCKACKDNFLAKLRRDQHRMKAWLSKPRKVMESDSSSGP